MQKTISLLSSLALIFSTSSSFADQRVVHLGTLSNNSASLWLSAFAWQADHYRLESDNTPFVDYFQNGDFHVDSSGGFHFTFSSDTNPGEAGRHSLYDDDYNTLMASAPQDSSLIIPVPGQSGGSGGGVGGGSGGNVIDQIVGALGSSNLAVLTNRSHSISHRIVDSMIFAPNVSDTNGSLKHSFWVDNQNINFSNDSDRINLDGDVLDIYAGWDFRVNRDLLVGLAVGYETIDSNAYRNSATTAKKGYLIGPYFGYQLNENIILDGWLGYANMETETSISIARGDYDSDRYFGSINLSGVYDPTNQIRMIPKLSCYYGKEYSDEFYLHIASGLNQALYPVSSMEYRYGIGRISNDFQYRFNENGGYQWNPYFRLGVNYAFERPNDGKILRNDLSYEESSAWYGDGKLGVKLNVDKAFVLDTGVSYAKVPGSNQEAVLYQIAMTWFLF